MVTYSELYNSDKTHIEYASYGHRIFTVKSPMLSLRWPRRFTLYSPLKRPIKDPPEMGTDLYISIKDEADYAKHIRYLIWLTRR